MTGLALASLAVLLLVVALGQLADLLAHVSRYRRYLDLYPACRRHDRGRVWKSTR